MRTFQHVKNVATVYVNMLTLSIAVATVSVNMFTLSVAVATRKH